MNIKKTFSDPIYGFIPIRSTKILNFIDHPHFQKLRRITQLGLSTFVYPGANHSRFQHSLGCFHLMQSSIQILQDKGIKITSKELEGALAGALLHDIGHGPFSHALEHQWVDGVSHEYFSQIILEKLMNEGHDLGLTMDIMKNKYSRQFFHSLISGQLDLDRLDYIRRDSFYTGVKEGEVNTQRLLYMLNVRGDELVLEYKGLYSFEKYLVARRILYWQVYLHKTALSSEFLLNQVVNRAKEIPDISLENVSESLRFFLKNKWKKSDVEKDKEKFVDVYTQMDDSDMIMALKSWSNCKDRTLKNLAFKILNRKLLKVNFSSQVIPQEKVSDLREIYAKKHDISLKEASYFIFAKTVENKAYISKNKEVNILFKNENIEKATLAEDLPHLEALSTIVKKQYLFYPEELMSEVKKMNLK